MLYFRKYLPSFVLLITIMISGLYSISAYSSTLTYWTHGNTGSNQWSSGEEACGRGRVPGNWWPVPANNYLTLVLSSTDKYDCKWQGSSGIEYHGTASRFTQECQHGDNGSACNTSCDLPSSMVDGQCIAPPQCDEGSFWDFETESCKYPEDELCPTGSNWDPVTQDCVCDGAGILSNASGFRICMQPADDTCNSESADFVGYINGTKPYCSGRARCASGSVPGTITVGGVTEYVCVPAPNAEDPKCPNGAVGNYNGQLVCVPEPNNDPSCPSGQSGTVNGEKVCIPKPGDPGSCGPGETPGFVGTGADMQPVCVPSDYKPETCPAGQYAWNSETGGFACVTIPSTPNIGDDGGPSGPGEGGSGDNAIVGTGTTKDAEGNVTGTTEIELKLPDGLLQDQPQTNYFDETSKFGDEQLEQLDADTAGILSDFSGADGAFTERNSLDAASERLLGLFGYSTSCSGDLIFWQTETRTIKASCEKLDRMRELLGWFLYVSTLMGIYNILMQKQEN